MKVEVIGKFQGKSNKGNDYIIVDTLCPYRGDNCEGMRTDRVFLNPLDTRYSDIEVGATYNIDRDSGGYIIGFEKVY